MIDSLLFFFAEFLLGVVDLFWHIGLGDYCPCERCEDRRKVVLAGRPSDT